MSTTKVGRIVYKESRTTLGVKKTTKDKLDKYRAPGQCYDGFICQLIDLWEKVKEEEISSIAAATGRNQGRD